MATILAADIGGTNCRLGLFTSKGYALTMESTARVGTENIASLESLFAAFDRETRQECATADMVVVALAGPVENNSKGHLSNGMLNLDFASVDTGDGRFFLINDFMAQAYAVLSPQGEKARHIAGPRERSADGARAVIGAGTGLGYASLVRVANGENSSHWLAAPSENGHANFPFVSGAENDFHAFLCGKLRLPYATGDDTITGRGLEALHEFLTGQNLGAAQVGAQALGEESATLRWYARLYARACRNWMLATMCHGGIWIAGGIAAQNPLVVTCPHFIQELYSAPGGSEIWQKFLRSVPVYLLEDTDSGLWGAACFGQSQLSRN